MPPARSANQIGVSMAYPTNRTPLESLLNGGTRETGGSLHPPECGRQPGALSSAEQALLAPSECSPEQIRVIHFLGSVQPSGFARCTAVATHAAGGREAATGAGAWAP